eukprot:1260863-Rhodomonas_salina.1
MSNRTLRRVLFVVALHLIGLDLEFCEAFGVGNLPLLFAPRTHCSKSTKLMATALEEGTAWADPMAKQALGGLDLQYPHKVRRTQHRCWWKVPVCCGFGVHRDDVTKGVR